MSEIIKAPKKERRFLKTLGKIGEVLLQEVIFKIGSNLIKKIGGKKNLPSLLFLFFTLSAIAQYPATGNKQRLGFQTTGDGLVYRGRAADTVSIKSTGLNNAYFILDTVNNVLFNYIKTKGGWVFNNSDTVIVNNTTDTTSLSNRINLKLNKSDTAAMLTNYLKSSVNLASQVTGILPLVNGGTGSNTESGARTNLGGTSIGQYLFTLTNGNTNKYARFDANNQVTLLTSTELKTDIGAGVGSVTSVAMTVPTLLSISGSPITTSGTLALTYSGTALPIANGGTAATTISQARVNLQVPNISTTITPQAPLTGGGSLAGDRTISIPVATSIANGYLSSTDFVTFNAKGNGTVTNVSAFGTPNGLSVANNTTTPVISMALAASGTIGVVSATTQTFSGSKTFANDLATSGAFSASGLSTLTGGASVGTMATQANLTHVLGVDASNNIGELGLGVGMSVGSGILSVQAAGASTTGLVTSSTQTFGGNKTFNGTVTLALATGTATSVVGRSSTGQVVDVTLGSGLSLASGTLTATATGTVTSVTGSGAIQSSGGTTPNITVSSADALTNGVVTTIAQAFEGAKNFNKSVRTNQFYSVNGITVITANYTVLDADTYIAVNGSSTVTITLPAPSSYTGRILTIKNTQAFTVISASSNVIGMQNTSVTSNAILPITDGSWCTLVSNGTAWMQMASGVPNQ